VELPGRRALALLRTRLNAHELPLLWARLEQRVEQAHVPAGPFGHARRWLTVLKESATRANRLIDVRELMQATGLDEHVAKADAYFSTAGWQTMHARKPFADPLEAEALTRSISVLIPHLELSPGIRLLDFGAGTCWSSLIWAYLGCTVIATDVSANALRFGEERVRADPIGKDLPISFLRFDGRRFDLPDASVDRIVGIDTLHHVLDIPGTLAELARLVAPGGIVAFSEPGPLHSMGPQAQHEMATTGVIENDIRVAEIRAAALAAGFADMRVAWFSPHACLYNVDEFDRLASGNISASNAKRLVRNIGTDMANIRIFFLYAPGSRLLTSQNATGLAAQLEGRLHYDGTRLHGTLTATNTGRATWLPSGSERGAVNIGIQLRNAAGTQTGESRYPLTPTPVAPGESATTEIDLPLEGADTFVIDLVAEAITWFASTGTAPIHLRRG
jgi:cyclopropane fatty-acyl-phospholipid synthase-like methyltransferase